MELVDGQELEVGHLQHVGGEEDSLQRVHLLALHPTPVHVLPTHIYNY